MAQINLSIRRDSGVTITAEATVDDSYVADIATTLGAILFDASTKSEVATEDEVPEVDSEPAEPATPEATEDTV
jgi:hypothetical protein